MKKYSIVLIIFCLVLFTGCADTKVEYVEREVEIETEKIVKEYVEVEVPVEVIKGTDGKVEEVSNIPALQNRKIIYTSNLVLNSSEPDDVYNNVINKLRVYDAYVEQENITQKRYTLKIRVKSDNLIDFINDIKTTGEVVSYSKSSQDVTTSYSTYESRKEALEAEHQRILELIEIADSLESIIALEAVRVDLEAELNYINNQLTNYDSLIDYSTINLTINLLDNSPKPLPISGMPRISVMEYDTESITFRIYNSSENEATVYANIILNGVLVEEFHEVTPASSYVTFTIENLESNSEYSIEAYAKESEHSDSDEIYKYVTTEKTFLDKGVDLFEGSINSLVSAFEFIVLGLIILSPYLVILAVLFIPIRFIYKRYKK